MKLLIDLQAAQSASRYRGIGRYSLDLAQAMVPQALAQGHEVVILLSNAFYDGVEEVRTAFAGVLPDAAFRVFSVPSKLNHSSTANRWRIGAAEAIRESVIAAEAPDMVHIASLFEGFHDDTVTSVLPKAERDYSVAVTLYDLIPYFNQEAYLPDAVSRAWYDAKIAALKEADALLAISESAGREVLEAEGLSFDPSAIARISAGAGAQFKALDWNAAEQRLFLEEQGIEEGFVLYTAGIDSRKNIAGLVEAYALLPEVLRDEHPLVVVCKANALEAGGLEKLLAKHGLPQGAVRFLTEYVSDDTLVKLYNTCELMVFPSLYEGFGLPVLEAMRCGAAVIGSDCTSIPEVIGMKAAMFDPKDAGAIAASMEKALTDAVFAESLRKNGAKQAAKFSWEKSAQKALAAMEVAVQERPARENEALSAEGSAEKTLAQVAALEGAPSLSDLEQVALAITESFPLKRVPHLLVDVSELVHRDARTGIQRVVNNVVTHLLATPPEGHDIKLVYREGDVYRYATAFTGKRQGTPKAASQTDDYVDIQPGDVFLGLDLDSHLHPAAVEFLRYHRARGLKVHFVVYDLLPVQMPECFPDGAGNNHAVWLGKLAQVADSLVGISKAVADDLREWLVQTHPNRAPHVQVGHFHLGADIPADSGVVSGAEQEKVRAIMPEGSQSFLMVGTVEPRKGHADALAAMERLWAQGSEARLVIVGKMGWKVDALAKKLRSHAQAGKKLFWLESGISDDMLLALYESCSAVLMASKGEGFGLPLIEAAQHDKPIVARDIPVFREIGGDYAAYFPADASPEVLAERLARWLDDFAKGTHPKSTGFPFLTWAQSTTQLMDALLDSGDYKEGQRNAA